VVPLHAFLERLGNPPQEQVADRIIDLMMQFLHEHQPPEKRREAVRA
jgi:hypothetical protein